jgi:hypothetical protein
VVIFLFVPRAVNTGVAGGPGFSVSQARVARVVVASSGVILVLRPLPWLAMCAAGLLVWTSDRVRVRELGDAHAGGDHHEDQEVVASSGPGCGWRAGEQRVDLGSGEVGQDRLGVVLGGDREDPGDQLGVLGMPERGVAVEGVDRGQARVARLDAVGAALLEHRQERGDQLGIEDADVQVAGLDGGALVNVGQEQSQGVAVGADRVVARCALTD